MTRDVDHWISDYFAASSRDLTPAPARDVAQVLYAPVLSDPEVTRRCESVLSGIELRRADRLATDGDKALFKQRRAFRRFCGALGLESARPLSEIEFIETENGVPHLSDLPGFQFSFSSCSFGFLGAWSSTHGIGVDIEDQTRRLEAIELAQQFFAGAEARAVEESRGLARLQTFFQFWTLKEAALKSIGEGMPFGLEAFEFELEPGLRVIQAPPGYGGPKNFSAHVIEGSNSFAALVTRSLA